MPDPARTSDPARSANPFQPLVLILASLFTLTACSYGVMYLRLQAPAEAEASVAGRWLMSLMERRGEPILAVQLVLLAAVILAAIFWDRRRFRD